MPKKTSFDFSFDRFMLANSRLIAKGRAIRDVERLIDDYGGHAKSWMKKSSAPLIMNGRPLEVHWYECQGIGRVEVKIKWI